MLDVVHWCWRVKLKLSLELDLMGRLRQAAEDEAVRVFASNLKDVLMSAPAGGRATLGLDPGLRTGCKVAVIAATGKVLEFATIYPHEPKRQWDESIAVLAALCLRHGLELVAIGNGTASRETDKLADDLMKRHPELKLTKVMVSEAGASVYSASEYASKELPELDVTIRGAVSIARRLQDPLAELVKIDPEIDRCRPVPARRCRVPPVEGAGCGGRGLRERGWCRNQHGLRQAARPRLGPWVRALPRTSSPSVTPTARSNRGKNC